MPTSSFSAEQIIGILKEHPKTSAARREEACRRKGEAQKGADDDELRRRLHQFAAEHRRFGYKRLPILLRQGGRPGAADRLDRSRARRYLRDAACCGHS